MVGRLIARKKTHTRRISQVGFNRYGYRGGFLWVRETFRHRLDDAHGAHITYEADGSVYVPSFEEKRAYEFLRKCKRYDGSYSPAMYMPRDLSRIDLRIEGQPWFEHVADISDTDIRLEGIPETVAESESLVSSLGMTMAGWLSLSLREKFEKVWNSLHKKPKPVVRSDEGRRIVSHYISYPFSGESHETTLRGKPLHIVANPKVLVLPFRVRKIRR